jgi:hypothetical protein
VEGHGRTKGGKRRRDGNNGKEGNNGKFTGEVVCKYTPQQTGERGEGR